MNLWQKAVQWTRVLSLREPQHWRNHTNEAASGEPVTETSVLALSAVWACVNLLAGTIASLSFEIRRPAPAGGFVTVEDHPLHRLLHESPNADQTAYEFWEVASAALELRGNFHARISRAQDRIIALTPVLAPVEAKRQTNGSIRYRWTEDGKSFDEPQENVFHVRGFGGDPLGGLSTLSYGRQVFGLAAAVDKAAASTFKNGLRPSVQLGFDKFLTDDQRRLVEQRLVEKYSGAVNAGKPFVTEGGMELKTISISPEDAQMLESRGFSVEEVCRFFGVPPFMVGHTEKSTSWGTGLEQQTLGFQKFSLRRRTKRIEQAVRKQLMTPADRAARLKARFNFEDLLRGDSAARSQFYTAGLTNGWMTINEVRALEGLPPVQGGDVPRMQMQNVPITEAGHTPQEGAA